MRHRYSPGPAKRFAQAIGAVFTLTATLLWYAAGEHTAALALVGVVAVFASLEAAFGLCVGCRVFYLGDAGRARAAARVRGLPARACGPLEILEVDEQLELGLARRRSRP